MKRALVYASVASMIKQFNMDNIRLLLETGYKVDVACNMEWGSTIPAEEIARMEQQLKEMNVQVFHIPLPRKISAIGNIVKSFRLTRNLINDNAYDLIHCHSPIGSIVCRLANRCSKQYRKAKMIYTAHGFHFFRGSPKANWILFYPVEKMLSRYTDVLITINKEDFDLATNRFHAKQVVKVPGVGIDTQRFYECSIDRVAFRENLGVGENDFLILSVGELCDRKNHATIIRAIHQLNNPNIRYAIVGKGAYQQNLQELISALGMEKQVMLLEYRSDIPELCKAADLFAFASKREGLGLAAIEAMAAGLPIVTSNVNGINDYSENGVTGYSCGPLDVDKFAENIRACVTNPEWMEQVKEHNIEAAKRYDIHVVNEIMKSVYES